MISLFDCSHARVCERKISCSAGKKLPAYMTFNKMAHGDPMTPTVCQFCLTFESMGDILPDNEKGWMKK